MSVSTTTIPKRDASDQDKIQWLREEIESYLSLD